MSTIADGLKHLADALKNQPGMLALLAINLVFLAIIYSAVRDERQATTEQAKQMLLQISNAQSLLAKCAADK